MTTMTTTNSTKAIYWATILSACTMGETAGDFLSFGLKFGYGWASCTLVVLLVIALVAEARAKVPNEARYWTTIVIMSTTGTAFADFITRTLKLGYGRGSAFLTALFAVIYLLERLFKKTGLLNTSQAKASVLPHIHIDATSKSVLPQININPHTRILPATDAFYWAAILVASTFGTTMGDFVSDVLGFGFGRGSLFLGSLLAIVLFVEFRSKVSNKPRYWTALVITSTMGATTGDFLTKPDALNLGYGWGAAVLIAVFSAIFFIGYRLKPVSS